ncbi:hypothetical protein FRC04_002847 [Tulasnella sp. 424]|nr:hypothetical protein FRC04_002847 [Tulasnella sp. 424]KAG8962702.1 hypothetical protein FRC05_005158 [Tulasnella sp. 425]
MAIIASALLARVLWLASISASTLPQRERSSSPMPQYDLPDYISQSIGPYSARYPVYSFRSYKHIPSDLPHGCHVVQVNILQRHGARYPTSGSWSSITSAVSKIKAAALLNPQAAAHSPLAFVSTYNFTLATDSLVDFGRLQAYTSGKYISDHYHHLSSSGTFIRSTSKDRVLESARWFKHGFEGKSFPFPISDLELPDVVIPTGSSNNSTLSVDNCAAAEAAPEDDPNAPNTQWLSIYAAPVAKRLGAFIPGLALTATDANALMSLCGFDTAFRNGKASPWCGIFKKDEWADNEYYWDLEKYYGSSYGLPYAKAQGSGWVNELIARLTGKPVLVTGAINGTLDSDPKTFPLPPNSPSIFADFSSDNNIAHMIAALGILNDANPLPAQGPPPKNHVFVSSKLVPFSTSLVVEKLVCRRQVHLRGHDSAAEDVTASKGTEEYVRMVLNEGVVPLDLQECGKIGVKLGMCRLEDFVKSQSFSQRGGDWDKVCSLH